jgi:hypothetical protein
MRGDRVVQGPQKTSNTYSICFANEYIGKKGTEMTVQKWERKASDACRRARGVVASGIDNAADLMRLYTMNLGRKLTKSLVLSLAILSGTCSLASDYKPLRSWIKTGLVAYQSSMTPAQIDWAAQHFDYFDAPYTQFLAQYEADTTAPILFYDNYYCLYVGAAKYTAMVNYALANGLSIEDMFLHFRVATTITFPDGTYTLPAGSRVPSYGWYGTGGNLTQNGARVFMNPGNAGYRAFNAAYQRSQLAATYGGASYTGTFVDNSTPGVLSSTSGTIVSGGTFVEYPGTLAEASAAYDADIAATFAAVRETLGPKGAAGSKLQVPNGAISRVSSSQNWTALFPYIDASYMEFAIQPSGNYSINLATMVGAIASADAARVPAIVSASVVSLAAWASIPSQELMAGLAEYYLSATPSSYFVLQDDNSGAPETYSWFPAIEYNVGAPSVGAPNTPVLSGMQPNGYYVLASGIDPSDGVSKYEVLARLFDNGIAIYKGRATWNDNTGPSSDTTQNLPITSDNPTGTYYELNADGSVSSSPVTQVTLPNAAGGLWIKASVINGATSCTYSLALTSANVGASGGNGTVQLTTQPECEWRAESNASLITITSGSSGTGSGMVGYMVAANTTSNILTGTLSIAGQTFTVTQAAALPTVTLSASPTMIDSGGSSTLTWSSTNATSCTASGGWAGTKGTRATTSVSPRSTTTYTLSCTGNGGSAQQSATVTVLAPPTVTLSAGPTSIASGGSSTLTWSSTSATSCSASGGWTGTKATSGTVKVAPTSTATYTLSCTGNDGSAQESATVTVLAPPTVTLSAGPTSIASGGSSTLTWSSTNTTSCSASGGWTGTKATSGTVKVSPSSTATYTLSCTGAGGSGQASTTVKVAPSVTLSASLATIASGGSSTLTWTSANATSCTASGGWTGTKGTSGAATVSPTSTVNYITTVFYELSCTGPGGSSQASTTVKVAPLPTVSLWASPTIIASGGSSTLTWSSANATSCTASGGWTGTKATSGTVSVSPTVMATYTLSCTGPGGSGQASTTVNVAPLVTLSASLATIASGGSSTLTWTSANATSCTASGGWTGTKTSSGTTTVSPTSTATYRLSCTGTGGSGQASTTVAVVAP